MQGEAFLELDGTARSELGNHESGYNCTISAGAMSPRSPLAPRQSPTAESARTLLTSPNKTR